MTDSLRDQLLGLGFKPAPQPERKPAPKGGPRARHQGRRAGGGDARAAGPKPHRDANAGGGAEPRSAAQAREPRPAGPQPPGPGKRAGARGPRPQRDAGDIDLAKAYAIRAQREKEERIEAERLKQEQARLRREAKAQVDVLLEGQGLNDAEADIARHFEYGGKIKRVHVNAGQLRALNAGELGVVQQNGRYLLVSAALLAQAEALFPACVALKVDPDAVDGDDPYADPRYQVPDDLVP